MTLLWLARWLLRTCDGVLQQVINRPHGWSPFFSELAQWLLLLWLSGGKSYHVKWKNVARCIVLPRDVLPA
ncbi:hypothetical protein HDV57DRAFT_492407 [Trichoderma longibrachiatum]